MRDAATIRTHVSSSSRGILAVGAGPISPSRYQMLQSIGLTEDEQHQELLLIQDAVDQLRVGDSNSSTVALLRGTTCTIQRLL